MVERGGRIVDGCAEPAECFRACVVRRHAVGDEVVDAISRSSSESLRVRHLPRRNGLKNFRSPAR